MLVLHVTIKKIMKHLFLNTLLILAFSVKLCAQDNAIFAKGEKAKNSNNYTGTIWLSELNQADTILNISLAQAVFAPAARLNWHKHPAGQYLLVTNGVGYYQERGKPMQVVKKGDIIRCLPNIEHWHGAAPNSHFTYIGVTPTHKGKTIWQQKVTDAEYNNAPKQTEILPNTVDTTTQNILAALSKQKWQWMADKNTDSLNTLFDDKAMFIHMGGTWGKTKELEVIKSGGIWYKKATVYEVTINLLGNTAILLNEIDLEAVVGGNTVVNPFMVTEVYVKDGEVWKMGSLTFSKLMRAVKVKN
jgi:4-carboxymuconolactone decarboxylase